MSVEPTIIVRNFSDLPSEEEQEQQNNIQENYAKQQKKHHSHHHQNTEQFHSLSNENLSSHYHLNIDSRLSCPSLHA